MFIRKATKCDVVGIQSLMDELNIYRSQIFSRKTQDFHERVNHHLPLKESDLDDEIFFIAVSNEEEVVGYIQGSLHERKNHIFNKLGYLEELFVRTDQRGKGLAGKLFQALEAQLKLRGCDHLTTHTDFENELSQQFYLDQGMYKTTVELWKKLA